MTSWLHLAGFVNRHPESPLYGKNISWLRNQSTQDLHLQVEHETVLVLTVFEAQMLLSTLMGGTRHHTPTEYRAGLSIHQLRSFAEHHGFAITNKTQPTTGEVWAIGYSYSDPAYMRTSAGGWVTINGIVPNYDVFAYGAVKLANSLDQYLHMKTSNQEWETPQPGRAITDWAGFTQRSDPPPEPPRSPSPRSIMGLLGFINHHPESPLYGQKIQVDSDTTTHALLIHTADQLFATLTVFETQLTTAILMTSEYREGLGVEDLWSLANQFGFQITNNTQPKAGEVWDIFDANFTRVKCFYISKGFWVSLCGQDIQGGTALVKLADSFEKYLQNPHLGQSIRESKGYHQRFNPPGAP